MTVENNAQTSSVAVNSSVDNVNDVPNHPGELTKRDYYSTYVRSTFLLGSFNFERMQAIGFAVSMIPAIKRFYSKKEDQAAALGRHLEFFNTHPWIASPIIGVTAAMERQKAAGEDIDEAAITNVKVGLMGPLAGVGDPIFWGTARPVLAALGASIALSGNILGPLIFFFGLTIIRMITRWYGFRIGYQKGVEIVSEVGGNTLRRFTQIASIVGLFVMGSLVSKWTTINVPFELSRYQAQDGSEVVTTVQSILDTLLPGMLALGLTFLCMWLLKKKINPIWIIFGMFAVGILGYWAGILAP
ncbi:PTS system mannose/fructose/sorbose family transporter subunit IID [Rothia aerolata]|uniref:PTS system mannose-specific transporter subunit IID n=1 Tax=Rothia aerolata TaxID=1812262 RepID=A0A917IYF4_9MICC|nr:PTS mannose transporter subunit IID [Rothia aerolata]GGH66358.1 PTS system mannose-specific transporter subunit IID [Rothia aerolata]